MKKKIHYLKCWSEPFNAMWDGLKTYEIRRLDRDYAIGDFLVLQEYDPARMSYLGREINLEVTYMTCPGQWGIPEGIVVMGGTVKGKFELSMATPQPSGEKK